MKTPTFLTPRDALAKLKVSPGGHGGSERLASDVTVSMFEAERGSEHPYVLVLRYGGRQQTVALRTEDVVTKGRSQWRRDNVWRLRPETIARFEPQITAVLAKLAAKAAEASKETAC